MVEQLFCYVPLKDVNVCLGSIMSVSATAFSLENLQQHIRV